MYALVNQADDQDIAGYLILKKFHIGWQEQDVCIYADYRNKGLGIDLYVKVIQMGIQLISGCSLSNEAERMWKEKLPKYVNVNTFNVDGSITAFSDKPTLDKMSDDEQQWFYIASSKNKVPTGLDENYSSNDGLNNLLYENWLRNIGIKTRSYRSSKYGEEGDF